MLEEKVKENKFENRANATMPDNPQVLGRENGVVQQITDNFCTGDRYVSGSFKSAAVGKLNLPMVQPQLVTEGGNHVRNTDSIDDALVPKFIRFTIDQSWLETASGEPEGERISVVVAARPVLCGWQAAKFTGPHHDRAVQ